jgi:hypothetical protein
MSAITPVHASSSSDSGSLLEALDSVAPLPNAMPLLQPSSSLWAHLTPDPAVGDLLVELSDMRSPPLSLAVPRDTPGLNDGPFSFNPSNPFNVGSDSGLSSATSPSSSLLPKNFLC